MSMKELQVKIEYSFDIIMIFFIFSFLDLHLYGIYT